jgi:large repetitive protein
VGSFQGTGSFNPDGITSLLTASGTNTGFGGSFNTYVSKLKTDGTFGWAAVIGAGADLALGQRIALDTSGAVYTTGYFQGTGSFDPAGTQNLTSSPATTDNAFVSKLSNTGAYAWAAEVGAGSTFTLGMGLALDGSGHVYTTGVLTGTGNFDPAGSHPVASVSGSQDAYILQLTDSGATPLRTTTTVATSGSTSTYGAPVTFTATVAGSGSAKPTGTVTFNIDGTPLTPGVPLDGNGQATFQFSTFTVGQHNVYASYSGDNNYQPSDDSATPLTQTVVHASTTTTLSAAPNPAPAGQKLVITVTVSSAGGTPTGQVIVKVDNQQQAPIALNSGQVTLTLSSLVAGAHAITAQYTGDPNFAGSSTATPLTEVVNGTATQLMFQQSPSTAVAGSILSPALTVAVEDANGNVVAGDTSTVSMTITSGPGTLGGTTSVAAVNGIATFSDLTLSAAG